MEGRKTSQDEAYPKSEAISVPKTQPGIAHLSRQNLKHCLGRSWYRGPTLTSLSRRSTATAGTHWGDQPGSSAACTFCTLCHCYFEIQRLQVLTGPSFTSISISSAWLSRPRCFRSLIASDPFSVGWTYLCHERELSIGA
jgi:hypothetical protein